MTEKFKVMGKEERTYTDNSTGEVKTARTLHVLYENVTREGMTGQKVEAIYMPRSVDGIAFDKIRINGDYSPDYEIRSTKNGKMAYLVGVIAIKEGGV